MRPRYRSIYFRKQIVIDWTWTFWIIDLSQFLGYPLHFSFIYVRTLTWVVPSIPLFTFFLLDLIRYPLFFPRMQLQQS